MTWESGRERIRQLIDDGEIEQVTPDITIARNLLADAGRHLHTASAAKSPPSSARPCASSVPSAESAGHEMPSNTQQQCSRPYSRRR